VSSTHVHPLARSVALAARLLAGVSVRWVDCPQTGGTRVYYANHSSHMDFAILWASLPRDLRARTRPVAAHDYWSAKRSRRYLAEHVFRALLVQRSDVAAMSGAAAVAGSRSTLSRLLGALQDGDSLIIFPEGTRGTGEQVSPFRSGIYHLAHRTPGLELVPAYLRNLNRILPKGEFLPVPMIADVTFGPPITLAENESRDEFLDRARAALCALEHA
jgi:1-acyl-sn-glycerol-3-phosphate acyltransferase